MSVAPRRRRASRASLRFSSALVVGVSCFFSTREVGAQELAARTDPSGATGLEIVWSSRGACSGLDELEREARRLLGESVDGAGVRVEVSLVRLPDGRFRIDLVLEGRASGARSLEADRCEDALRAGAVVLALAVNPELIDAPVREEEVREAPEKSAQPPAVVSASAVVGEESGSGFWQGAAPFVGIHGRLGAGLTPGPRAGLGLMLGVDFDWLRLEARGALDPEVSEVDPVDGPTRLGAVGGSLRACARGVEARSLALRFCAGASLFEVSAFAEELEDAAPTAAVVVNVDLQLSLAWRFAGPLSLVLDAGYVVPTTGPRFIVERGEEPARVVHRVSPGPLGTAGIEVGF